MERVSNLINLRTISGDLTEWAKEEGNVYIGHKHPKLEGIPCDWGNPYTIKRSNGRDACVQLYRQYRCGTKMINILSCIDRGTIDHNLSMVWIAIHTTTNIKSLSRCPR